MDTGGSGYRATGAVPAPPVGGVTSFNARTGDVVSQLGDYTSDIVGDASLFGGPTTEDSLNLAYAQIQSALDSFQVALFDGETFDDLTYASTTWADLVAVWDLQTAQIFGAITRALASGVTSFLLTAPGTYLACMTTGVPANGSAIGYRWKVDGVVNTTHMAFAGASPTMHTYLAYLPGPGSFGDPPRICNLEYCRANALNETFLGATIAGQACATARLTIWRVPS